MSPPIQWYPGHIAKAERELKEQLKNVDVVLEVRDARLPRISHHPQLASWLGTKPRLLILNRVDSIPPSCRQSWSKWFESVGDVPYFTNAKQGTGIEAVKKAARLLGKAVNEKRRDRGMLPRPVRAVVIGFPNVGKSALINRLVGKNIVRSARRAGVTRQLQWVRIAEELELLDAPGIIPWRLENQEDAIKLAICEDLGEAAYDNQIIATALVDLLRELNHTEIFQSRYHEELSWLTGEEYLEALANKQYKGDKERVARLLLDDFRKGFLGPIALEWPEI